MENFSIRPIRPDDNVAIAAIIREVMPEFGANGPGFAIHDPEVDTMAQAYTRPRCAYFVLETDGRVVGGGGVAPLEGGDRDTCELRKMYFLSSARGSGAGQAMLDLCLHTARTLGFRRCYLETLGGMQAARKLYLRNGFEAIDKPLGSTGHFGCDAWYLRPL